MLNFFENGFILLIFHLIYMINYITIFTFYSHDLINYTYFICYNNNYNL